MHPSDEPDSFHGIGRSAGDVGVLLPQERGLSDCGQGCRRELTARYLLGMAEGRAVCEEAGEQQINGPFSLNFILHRDLSCSLHNG